VGFEPTVGSTPTQLFESCTFGRSDTVPRKILVQDPPVFRIGRSAARPNKSVARWLTPALVLVATLGLGVLSGVLVGRNTGDDARASGGAGFGGSDSSAGAPGDRIAGDLTTGTAVPTDRE
ncbi:MAG: hypothetical protein JWM51_1162, partial [Microbacteriaceae bacterium]|nr:hypothetical protein [Microbacteriaceae bacterium]